MRASILVSVLAIALLPDQSLAQRVRVTGSSPSEAKLAAIDEATTVVSVGLIRQYASLLNRLDPKCKEDRTLVGDIAAKGVELLREEKGVRTSILKFLQAMDDSIPEEGASLNLSCAEVAAALVVMIDRP